MHPPLPAPRAHLALRCGLLLGPVVLAFFSGGFFDDARLWALAAAWLAVLGVARYAAVPLPRGRAALAAIAGLLLLTGWIGLSRAWAPLQDAAGDDFERSLLYAGFLVASVAMWRERGAARTAELAVAAGAALVTVYGLSGRLVPWLVEQSSSMSAGGRLDQPLTYWNAQGALAAMGAVLMVRVAGDRTRGPGERVIAAAVTAPLAAGVYLSFSRGAVLALVCGVLVLLACSPTYSQLRAIGIAVVTGGPVVVVSALTPAVRALEGGAADRNAQGALVLGVLLVACLAAAFLTRLASRDEEEGAVRLGRLPLPQRGVGVTVLVACSIAVVLPVLVSGDSRSEPAFGATTQRFTDVGSNRDRYWDVALATFADHPVIGVGSAGFVVEWQRERTVNDGVRDAHSLPFETAAELGVIGLVLLVGLLGSVAWCGRLVQRTDPASATGACAALTVWLTHACLDWDWEMPALTLPALTLAAVLIARADDESARHATARPG